MICQTLYNLIPRFGSNMNGDALFFWFGKRWLYNKFKRKWSEV
jgi:hypothetical protein